MTTFLRRLISATFVASGMLKAVNLDAFGQTVGSFLGLFGLPPEHAYALGALVCAGETALGYAPWSGSRWEPLGEKTASADTIVFQNVPSEGLYLLRDKTKGREERIFTYENDKQIWW